MSLRAITACLKPLQLAERGLKISITGTAVQERYRFAPPPPKKLNPSWYTKQYRAKYDEMLTSENKEFIEQVIIDKYGPKQNIGGVERYLHTPLKREPVLRGEWFPNCRRTGLIGIKLGIIQQWLTNGKPIVATLIQIVDNHVIKYIPPEDFVVLRKRYARRFFKEGKYGCLIVGAVNCDPQMFTKEYTGLFTEAGVMPKKILTKFPIHPCAAIQPGTPLYASHFKPGDYVDISGISVFRGFQGVMKRFGFHGQKASHGVTKTHRAPGNIGAGGQKARVWPGKKMPGLMGNKFRTQRGVKILRIDNKLDVLYVVGQGIPGDVNSFVYIHDTILPLKRLTESPRFPTYYPEDFINNPLPEEEFDSELFKFTDPTIIFPEDVKGKK